MTMYRRERVSDLLLSFLAEQIRELRDPRLQFVTLTSVDVSSDLKVAHVYWSLPNVSSGNPSETLLAEASSDFTPSDEMQRKSAEQAFSRAAKLLRRRIAEELELRYVPELVLRYDPSSEVGSRIDFLLKKAGL